MVREYKSKRTESYTAGDLDNAVKEVMEGGMSLRKAHIK